MICPFGLKTLMNDTKSHFLIIEILLKDYKRKDYSQKEVKNINSKRNKNSLKKQENLQLRYLREFSFIHKDVVYRVCDV